MLEQVTLYQVVAFIFSAGGIAVLLQRIPGWDAWQSGWKALIVTGLNLVAGFLLPAVTAQIPADVGNMTVDKIILGLFMAAGAFVIHQADTWLTAQVSMYKWRAQSHFKAPN